MLELKNLCFGVETEDSKKEIIKDVSFTADERFVAITGPNGGGKSTIARIIAGVVKQFWEEVIWGELDYLFVDMPPGTGDVPLTVFQSLPLDGVVIVTSPQDLVQMIVKKAYNMAVAMDIPVLGIVENYSYLECPDCGKKIHVFGESHIDEIAETSETSDNV